MDSEEIKKELGIQLSKINPHPKSGEIIVVTIDIEKFGLEEAQPIFELLKEMTPPDQIIVLTFKGINIGVSTLNKLINSLRKMKKAIRKSNKNL